MDYSLYNEILDDAAALVRQKAHARTGKIALSPETAELLEKLGRTAATPAPPASVVVEETSASDDLVTLATEVAQCQACALCKDRTQTVFSDGNGTAGLVFVGEAPGEEEDRQGVPFVGRSGQLLTDIIEKGMKLSRDDVYICNVIKCRPPSNRDPLPEEKDACEHYLIRQLELVKPKVICALGRHAAQSLLKTTESTGKLRGKWHSYRGIPLRVTYHPAYLLRSPSEKRKTWDDVQEIMKLLSGETAAP